MRILLSCIFFSLLWGITNRLSKLTRFNTPPVTTIPYPARVTDDQPLKAKVYRLVTANKRTQFQSLLLQEQLVTIASKYFITYQQQVTWVSLIGMESGYNPAARSVTGALGLGQLIPSYYADFGRTCGLGNVTKAELADNYTNLSLSACYFQEQLVVNNGDLEMAMNAYKNGPYSQDVRKMRAGTEVGNGTREYITAITKHAKE